MKKEPQKETDLVPVTGYVIDKSTHCLGQIKKTMDVILYGQFLSGCRNERDYRKSGKPEYKEIWKQVFGENSSGGEDSKRNIDVSEVNDDGII